MATSKAIKKLMFARTLIASSLLAAGASAAPIVTEWSFATNAKFSSPVFQTSRGGLTSASDYELSWGNATGDFQAPTGNSANNRSALTIGDIGDKTLTGGGPATGNVFTNTDGTPNILIGEVGLGINLSHWNNTISGFNTLLRAALIDTLTLTPLDNIDPLQAEVDAPTITFDFEFRETPNNPAGNPGCAGGTPEPCGDLVGFESIPTLNQAFTYHGNQYFASVLLLNEALDAAAPIAALDPGQCAALSFQGPCQGFLTTESARTTINFGFSVSSVPFNVPVAPSFGLVLAGLGILGWRSRQKA